jgi:hypothetical protein
MKTLPPQNNQIHQKKNSHTKTKGKSNVFAACKTSPMEIKNQGKKTHKLQLEKAFNLFWFDY